MNIRGLNSDNDNYVNELSIWAAYFIFLLSMILFQDAGGSPTLHAHRLHLQLHSMLCLYCCVLCIVVNHSLIL